VLAAMGVFHRWWLCNSGGCSGVVCSESGADLHKANNGVYIVSKGMVLVCVIIVFLHCETVRCGKSSSISATKIKELSRK
jgi:hypothetical protein